MVGKLYKLFLWIAKAISNEELLRIFRKFHDIDGGLVLTSNKFGNFQSLYVLKKLHNYRPKRVFFTQKALGKVENYNWLIYSHILIFLGFIFEQFIITYYT